MVRVLAGAALGAFIVAMIVIAIGSATSGGGGSTTTTVSRTTVVTRPAATAPKPPTGRAVVLTGAGAYDPEGDQHENDDLAPLAVDGDPTTFWMTEHYLHRFSKTGVGLLLDAGKHTTFSRVVVGTDGSGSSARIELGDNPAGPFDAVSAVRRLSGETTFKLTKAAAGRYLVVWITALPETIGEAHITEVRALS